MAGVWRTLRNDDPNSFAPGGEMKNKSERPQAAASRREFLQGLGVAVAALPGAVAASRVEAQQASEPPREVRAGLAGSNDGVFFHTVDTPYGKVQGIEMHDPRSDIRKFWDDMPAAIPARG
jgi:hypothetical protein